VGTAREELIAELAKESGLSDSESRRFLNAFIVKMNHDLTTSNVFIMPEVGSLTRATPGKKKDDSRHRDVGISFTIPSDKIHMPPGITPPLGEIAGDFLNRSAIGGIHPPTAAPIDTIVGGEGISPIFTSRVKGFKKTKGNQLIKANKLMVKRGQ
jgi:nucleoid DNA-binding protein